MKAGAESFDADMTPHAVLVLSIVGRIHALILLCRSAAVYDVDLTLAESFHMRGDIDLTGFRNTTCYMLYLWWLLAFFQELLGICTPGNRSCL